MLKSNKSLFEFIFLVVCACFLMAFTDSVLTPPYLIKSIIKWVLFFFIPLYYLFISKSNLHKKLLPIKKQSIIIGILFGIGTYGFILGGYFLLRMAFDFSQVTKTIDANLGVNATNFIYVSLYISLVNSLLEEFFFRFFVYYNLQRFVSKGKAMTFSAAAFGLYHLAIMNQWFSPLLFILLIIGLLITGFIFIWLNERTKTIFTSWIVHMFANFAINTIGFILFGIL